MMQRVPLKNIYDLAGRLTGIKEYPQGSEGIGYSTGYLYDKMDNLIEETKTDGSLTRNTRYEYDFLGRPIKEIKGSDTEDMAWTAYTYDNLGNKVSEERWNTLQNQLTTFEYDELNRLIKTIDPLGHIWQNYYDKAGNLILTLDPEGNGIQYLYDAMNRKIEERGVRLEYDLTDGWEITESLILSKYSYDSYGNTVLEEYNLSANNGEGYSRAYEYNQLNLAIQEEGFIGHDEVGQPMTTVITQEYDLTGQVTRESIDNNYSYIDLNSNQVAVSTPFQRDLVYNGRGWLVEERHFVWGDPHYQGRGYITINYDYDHLGNRVKITDARRRLNTKVYG